MFAPAPGGHTSCFGVIPITLGLTSKWLTTAIAFIPFAWDFVTAALGQMDGEDIVWFWIGPHSEYDKLLPG
jgi:hypothetical protein